LLQVHRTLVGWYGYNQAIINNATGLTGRCGGRPN